MSDEQAKIPLAYREVAARWGGPHPVEPAKERFVDLVGSAKAGRPVLLCRDDQEWAALLPVSADAVAQLAHMAEQDRADVRVAGFSSTLVGAWESRDLRAARRELAQLVRLAYRRRIAFALWSDDGPVGVVLAPIDVVTGPDQ